MKRERRLTRRERKAQEAAAAAGEASAHIHCVACGRHIDPGEFTGTPIRANYVRCEHGTRYAACKTCVPRAMSLLQEHDRTGRPVQAAQAWH